MNARSSHCLVFGFVVAAVASVAGDSARAQVILHQWNGTPQAPITDEFGRSVAGLGDVDGDAIPDIAIGAGSTQVQGTAFAGRVYVYSGRDGSLLQTIAGSPSYLGLGTSVAGVGDVDGDGAGDFLASWGDLGVTYYVPYYALFSGRTGQPMRPFRGHPVAERDPMRTFAGYLLAAGPGDVNGDGVPDLFFGDYEAAGRTGRAELISGRDGSILRSFIGHYPDHGFGWVKSGGDLDADGVPDLLVGAFGNWPRTAALGVYAYSGKTGAQLFFLPPPPNSDSFPSGLLGLGDVNGDGFDDVAVSDLGFRVTQNNKETLVYGGPSGRQLFSLRWNLNGAMGTSLCGPGDVDGDGFADFLVAGDADAFLISGRDRSVLFEWHGGVSTGAPGSPCARLGDIDGDDFPDLLMGGFRDPLAPAVRIVRVYSGAPRGVATLGLGCPDSRGVVPRIGASHLPEPGKPFAINLSRTLPGKTAALVMGLSSTSWGGTALPLDLGLIGMPGCLLRASVDRLVGTATTGPKDQGRASVEFTFPPDPALRGMRFFAQWLVLDPAAGSTTRAMDVTVQ